MTDYYLGVSPQSIAWELRSNVRRFPSPENGVTRTHERVGSRWAATFSWQNMKSTDAARLRAFLALQRGGGNRFWVTDPSYTQRGSLSAPELLTNSDFANGTTGWSSTNATLSAPDRELRLLATTPAASVQFYQSVALTQYAPHVLRSIICDGAQSPGLNIGRYLQDSVLSANDYGTSRGLGTVSLVASSAGAGAQCPAVVSSTSGFTAGAYVTVPYTSLSRCALVDNAPNLLLRSEEFDNAAWSKSKATVSANAGTAPDGSATYDVLVEDNTTGFHYVDQAVTVASSAQDIAFCVVVSPSARSFCWLEMTEGTGPSSVTQYFSVSGSGAVGASGATGANWSNRRAYVMQLGSGWVMCCLVARKTNAATSVTCRVGSATADGTGSYLGTMSSAVSLWRATCAPSSVPTAPRSTSSSLSSGVAQTGGALNLKGLPPSSSGLLVVGDWVEIITPTFSELKRVTAPLDSNAAGLGHLQFEPMLRQSPSNNAPVVIRKPMCRMLLDESTVRTEHRPGGFMSCSFTAVEDIAA